MVISKASLSYFKETTLKTVPFLQRFMGHHSKSVSILSFNAGQKCFQFQAPAALSTGKERPVLIS
jgi:hypothetical protein